MLMPQAEDRLAMLFEMAARCREFDALPGS
jgi:hypothetical protein